MPRYKRTADEAGLDTPSEPAAAPEHVALLHKLRNMWEFASFMQYVYLFGKAVKIDDDFDMEDFEAECLKPGPSQKLAEVGLQLLKYVSSHRGLTLEIFDEYTRRQYTAKAPHRNPYGVEEEPARFNAFDVFTKIRVLHQLSMWTLWNTDRLRGLMPDDEDHLSWRMEPLGWDSEDRAYYVLDDNRLYRRADETIPAPTPRKAKPKAKVKSRTAKQTPRSRGTRASKRLKTEESEAEDEMEVDDTEFPIEDTTMVDGDEVDEVGDEPGYGFTSKTWSLVAITLEEYNDFMATLFRTRDPNEKILRKRLEEDVIPIIEKRAEQLRAKELKKLRDLENMQKLAFAKRSSRLAGKAEKEKEDKEKRDAEEKRQQELKMAHEEEEKQRRIEEGHESRRLTREQRLKDREVKRILHEEELAKLKDIEERGDSQEPTGDEADASKRSSSRQARSQREQHEKELERLAEEENGSWYFDCSKCGMHGENLDDGSHSVACDKCGVWQHSKCLGFTPKQAEGDGFVFVCRTCTRKEEDAKRPKIPPIKLGKKNSGSPESQKTSSGREFGPKAQYLDGVYIPAPPKSSTTQQTINGSNPSVSWENKGLADFRYPAVGNFAPYNPQSSPPSSAHGQSSSQEAPGRHVPTYTNGHAQTPSPHRQQHQNAHNRAIASAGGHPAYHPPRAYPAHNGVAGSTHSSSTTIERPHDHSQAGQQYWHAHPSAPSPQVNGATSPVKPTVLLRANNSGQSTYEGQRINSTEDRVTGEAQGQSPTIHHSPQTTLHPPSRNYHQSAASPVKSSSPPNPRHQGLTESAQPAPVAQTPQGFKAPPAEAQSSYQTPSLGSAARVTGNLAADGMSGPWPIGSESIPRKHDQSPAPPSSSQTAGERTIVPPHPALVPSPEQESSSTNGKIPVKKMPAMPSPAAPMSSPLPAPAVSPTPPTVLKQPANADVTGE